MEFEGPYHMPVQTFMFQFRLCNVGGIDKTEATKEYPTWNVS